MTFCKVKICTQANQEREASGALAILYYFFLTFTFFIIIDIIDLYVSLTEKNKSRSDDKLLDHNTIPVCIPVTWTCFCLGHTIQCIVIL